MRRAAVVGHHQARAQHDRAQLGQRTAVGHLDIGAPQGVQLGAFARFLLAQHEGVAGVGAQQRLEPVGQPQVVRQAPALEGEMCIRDRLWPYIIFELIPGLPGVAFGAYAIHQNGSKIAWAAVLLSLSPLLTWLAI